LIGCIERLATRYFPSNAQSHWVTRFATRAAPFAAAILPSILTASTPVWTDDPLVLPPAYNTPRSAATSEGANVAPPAEQRAEPELTAEALAALAPSEQKLINVGNSTHRSQVFAVQSRELVDVEFMRDGALMILVSAPSAAAPGLYRWPANASAPTKLCNLYAVSTFSFDRRYVIERDSRVRVYSAADCSKVADIDVGGRPLDVDARDEQIAVAARGEQGIALQLRDFNGQLLASVRVGRNVEMGFAPDGQSIVNFDLSDAGPRKWSLPTLAAIREPAWMARSEVTFVPGARYVKRYSNGQLILVRWPSGHPLHTISASRNTRLRQVSDDGSVGLVHEYASRVDRLEWVNFVSGTRVQLAQGDQRGSIDNAALSGDLAQVAWTQRTGAGYEVRIHRATAPNR
jgi:hypothetical protein